MADNVTLSTNIGSGSVVATDDISSVHYPIHKLTFGALDSQTIASSGNGTVDAGCMRVTVASDSTGLVKLAAGTAEVGKLAAGVAVIGEVTIGAATGAAGDLAKLEDAGHTSGDVGVMALSVRKDTASATSGTDADYQPLITDANGRLHSNDVSTAAALSGSEFQVDIVAALPAGTNEIGKLAAGTAEIGNVKNAGTFVTQVDGAALTSLQLIDDTVYIDDADWSDGSSKHLLIGGLYQSSPQTVTDGDVAPAQMDVNGRLVVALSPTDNTVLDNIDTSLNNIEAAVGGTHVDDAAFTPGTDDGVPMFAAFDDTAPDSVDEGDAGIVRMSANRNLYGTIRDAAGNERGANVNASNAMSVTAVLTAGTAEIGKLAAGTAEIGKLAAGTAEIGKLGAGTAEIGKLAAGVAVIGEVTIGAATTAAGDLAKAEDVAHASGDVGVMALAVRQSTQADFAADGDYVPFSIDDDGALRVSGAGGGTQFADSAAFTLGSSLTTVASGVYQNGTPTSLTDNDAGAVLLNSTAGQMVELMASTASVGVVDLGSTDNAVLDVIASAAHADAATFTDSTSLGMGCYGVHQATPDTVADNDFSPILLNSTAGQLVELQAGTAEIGKLAAGVAAIGKLAANSGVDIGDVDVLSLPASTNTLEVVGDVAVSAAAAGNPVLAGVRCTATVEGLTEVSEGDSNYVNADLSGTLITRAACAPAELVSFYVANTDGAEDAVTSLDDGGAAIYNFITSVTIHNEHASTNGYVTLLDGSAGSIFWVFPAPATGGTTHNFDPPLRQPTISTACFVDVSAAITTMHISINGFQGNG